jgi:uncharacterized membrane protein
VVLKPAPPTSCVVKALPLPAGQTMALVSGADPAGRYLVGRSYPPSGGYQTLIWDNQRVRTVPMKGAETSLLDVNSAGVAVGTSYEQNGTSTTAWVYRDGKLSKLLGGASTAYAVNDAGTIAGGLLNDRGAQSPVVWPTSSVRPVPLSMPDKTYRGAARDIDEDGTVVATLTDDRDVDHAFAWLPDGDRVALKPPATNGGPAFTSMAAFSIRNGWITGWANRGNGQEAVRWNLRTGVATVFRDFNVRPSQANTFGWMVGSDVAGQALFVSENGPLKLPDLVAHRNSFDNIANTVSDTGRTIGGQSLGTDGKIRAVIWTCR